MRNDGSKLVLNHEPYGGGELFDDYCKKFSHAFMVANVKTEGIEDDVLRILERHGIVNFFLLDLTFPSIIRLSSSGEKRIAVRFSEHEPIESALAMKGRANWAWVDTFSTLPLDKKSHALLKGAGFSTCLVCPERWGRPRDIATYRAYLEKNNIMPDAVMTASKYAKEW